MIGPGRLVLVVGPSGAGKDTLIAQARAACAGDPAIVFPRRIVTRPATADEDHDTIAEAAFDRAAANGAFAFWWRAHGLKYALPLSVESDIGAGRTVVCNVSRTMVEPLRHRYADVAAVLITAPPAVIAARLAARGRPTDGALSGRLARAAETENCFTADFVIENVGTPEEGAAQLVATIRAAGFVPLL